MLLQAQYNMLDLFENKEKGNEILTWRMRAACIQDLNPIKIIPNNLLQELSKLLNKYGQVSRL
jgi:hypothetical protein